MTETKEMRQLRERVRKAELTCVLALGAVKAMLEMAMVHAYAAQMGHALEEGATYETVMEHAILQTIEMVSSQQEWAKQ